MPSSSGSQSRPVVPSERRAARPTINVLAVYDETEPGQVRRDMQNRCPRCNQISFTGVLGPGTCIEVWCSHCPARFQLTVPG